MVNPTGQKVWGLHWPGILKGKKNLIKCGKSGADNKVTFGSVLFSISVGHQFVKIRENQGKYLQKRCKTNSLKSKVAMNLVLPHVRKKKEWLKE